GRRPVRLLTRRASTLTRPQVIRALATAVDLSPDERARALDQLVVRPELIPLLADAGKGTRTECRRYTTADLLAVEEDLAQLAVARQSEGCGFVPVDPI